LNTKLEPIVANDVALLIVSGQSQCFARVEQIVEDTAPGWVNVTFTILVVPTKVLRFIVPESALIGGEFSVGGTPMRFEKLARPSAEEIEALSQSPQHQPTDAPDLPTEAVADVIDLASRRRKKDD